MLSRRVLLVSAAAVAVEASLSPSSADSTGPASEDGGRALTFLNTGTGTLVITGDLSPEHDIHLAVGDYVMCEADHAGIYRVVEQGTMPPAEA